MRASGGPAGCSRSNISCTRLCVPWDNPHLVARHRMLIAVFSRMASTRQVLLPDGSLLSVNLGASLASRGLLSVSKAQKPDGTVVLSQASWKKKLRAPAGKTTWSVTIPRGVSLFPPTDPLRDVHFGSCAVVGNSGSVLSPARPCGSEIDAHDAVWRINGAPVRGYEQFVGSRETVRVLNAAHPSYLHQLPRVMPPHWGKPPANGTPVLVVADATSAEAGEQFVRARQRFATASPASARPLARLVLKDHAVLHYYLALHAGRRRAHRGVWRADYPSTGLLAVMLATLSCRSVKLYGFSLHAGRDLERYAPGACEHVYHYWEQLGWRNLLAAHNLSVEAEIVRGLERAGAIRCDPRQGIGAGRGRAERKRRRTGPPAADGGGKVRGRAPADRK